MRAKKNAIPMKIDSYRPVYMVYQKSERTCGCTKAETCGKCRVVGLASLEVVIDGSIARYNQKKESVSVQAAPQIIYYRSGTPTGESVPGQIWRGSLSEFTRTYSKGFQSLCTQGWAMALAQSQEKKGKQ